MKPKFITEWREGRLVPVSVEGGNDLEFQIDRHGRPVVVMVWVKGDLIYRDPSYFHVGPI